MTKTRYFTKETCKICYGTGNTIHYNKSGKCDYCNGTGLLRGHDVTDLIEYILKEINYYLPILREGNITDYSKGKIKALDKSRQIILDSVEKVEE